MDEYYQLIRQFPNEMSEMFLEVKEEEAKKIQEIRFKTGALPMVTYSGIMCELHTLLKHNIAEHIVMQQTEVPNSFFTTVPITEQQLEQLLFHLCGGSVYAHEDELSHGFFTLPGGHRVGVGGKYYLNEDNRLILQKVTSFNIRVARNIPALVPSELEGVFTSHFSSLLILGSPGSGKTTILRSISVQLSEKRRTVVVIDERGEFSLEKIDCITGVEKSAAVQMALRTLSPEIIVLDELGTLDELHALEQGFFTGVQFIASLHAESFEEAKQKPQFRYLQEHGMLDVVCLLSGRQAAGKIKEVRNVCSFSD